MNSNEQPPTRDDGKSGSVSRARGKTLTTFGVGGLPIINHFLGRARVEEFLRSAMTDDQRCKISPDVGVLALIQNYLMSRQPVYGIQEWAQELSPDLLQLTEEQMLSLNDDRVGRCLDRLFDADCPSLILALTRHVMKEFDVELGEFHNDTTTITFHGGHDDASQENRVRGKWTPIITHGHNKDHRPDLKQLLFSLTVSSDGAVPVAFGVENGNVTDDQVHQETWELLCKIVESADFLYVADSKLATRANMSFIANRGGRFVSVLPRTRSEDEDFRQRVLAGEITWHEILRKFDAKGRVKDIISATQEEVSTSEGYRLLWFHSTRKVELDIKSRGNSVRRAVALLEDLSQKLSSPRTRYRDESKVHKEIEKRLASCGATKWITYSLKQIEEEKFVQEGKGRPNSDTRYRREVKLRFELSFDLNDQNLDDAAKQDGVFPLVTNDRKLAAKDILNAYKRQAHIEKRFSQLKTQFQVAPVYLKSTSRIVALLTVYYLALLIQALIERELRREMKGVGMESLPIYPEHRECKAPTTRRTLDLFDNIERHVLTMPGGASPTKFATELSEAQELVLQLLQVPGDDYDVDQ